MMEKGQMAPKDYILEFIETLKIEIEELKNSKDNNILLAENQSSMKDLRSNHSALALELSDLEKMAQADASAFRSALAATGLTEPALEREVQRLSSKISKLEQQRNELKRQISTLRRQVVVEASVVGATLSMAYMSSDLQAKHYDALFIDEISMAPLLPVFFAMSLAKSSCTLIGDFLQLPPIGTQSKNYLVKKWFKILICIINFILKIH